MEKKAVFEGAIEGLFLSFKHKKEDITKEQVENIIINIGNYLQTKRLEKNK